MSNEMLNDAYKLYEESVRSGELFQIYRTQSFLARLKKLYPGNAEIDSLYISSMMLLDKVRKIKNVPKSNINESEFILQNKEFFDAIIPKYLGKIRPFSYKKYDFTFLLNLTFSFLATNFFDMFMLFRKLLKEKKVLIRDCKNEEIREILAKRLPLDINDLNVSENYMGITNDASNGMTSPIMLAKNNYFVYVNKFKSIEDVSVLLHELAHVYYFRINNIRDKTYNDPEESIKYEIVPRTIELLFIDYLEKNGLYNEAKDANAFFDEAIVVDANCENQFLKYRYTIADFVAIESAPLIINQQITFKEFCRRIYKTPYDVILRDTRDYLERENLPFSK